MYSTSKEIQDVRMASDRLVMVVAVLGGGGIDEGGG